MLAEVRKIAAMAKIELQEYFCENCSVCIKNELQKKSSIKNIRLYPKESMITFNFNMANELSTALNVLSEIGYAEKGERITIKDTIKKSLCEC